MAEDTGQYEKGPEPNTFLPESRHLDGLLSERDLVNDGVVRTGIDYLDDCLGGVYPRDLWLLAAETGVGKTALALKIWLAGLNAGKVVYGLFLEAFQAEISYRLWFEELARITEDRYMDYSAWVRGQYSQLDKKYENRIKTALAKRMGKGMTFYKRGEFGAAQLKRKLEQIKGRAGMVVLDHFHTLDTFKAEDENSMQSKTIRLLEQFAIQESIPVVAVAHMKKRQNHNYSALIRGKEDVHGSSNLVKTCTQVVTFARHWDAEPEAPHLSPTLMKVDKDRRGREVPYVAQCNYNRSTGQYEPGYSLGRISKGAWAPLPAEKYPYWAKQPEQEEMF